MAENVALQQEQWLDIHDLFGKLSSTGPSGSLVVFKPSLIDGTFIFSLAPDDICHLFAHTHHCRVVKWHDVLQMPIGICDNRSCDELSHTTAFHSPFYLDESTTYKNFLCQFLVDIWEKVHESFDFHEGVWTIPLPIVYEELTRHLPEHFSKDAFIDRLAMYARQEPGMMWSKSMDYSVDEKFLKRKNGTVEVTVRHFLMNVCQSSICPDGHMEKWNFKGRTCPFGHIKNISTLRDLADSEHINLRVLETTRFVTKMCGGNTWPFLKKFVGQHLQIF